MLVHLDEDKFEELISTHDNVVFQMGASWCGPCKKFLPYFKEQSSTAEYSNILFVHADEEECSTLYERLNIAAMPTFLFYKNGKLIETLVGADKSIFDKTLALVSK